MCLEQRMHPAIADEPTHAIEAPVQAVSIFDV
jgi:hypothetical protein